MKYSVTKKQCQSKINEQDNVCNRCGRKIKPLKTTNNSGEPTYWAGCMHGQTDMGAWGHFTSGVKKEVYELAVKLVLEDSSEFGMSYGDKDTHDFDYAWQNALDKACGVVSQIEWMKTGKPRNTKNQLKKKYF